MTCLKEPECDPRRENVRRAIEMAGLAMKVQTSRHRDRREPGWLEKETREARISRLLRRYWRLQAERIRQKLEFYAPDRKAVMAPPKEYFDDVWFDDELEAALIKELQEAIRGGITLFGNRSKVQIDYTMINANASRWAHDYAAEWLQGINGTSAEFLQKMLEDFVNTPGMTIRDIMDMLPFDEQRALQIATTETTRVYAEGEQMAGRELQKEFPDVRVVKRWYTNDDGKVCEICFPLDGMEVGIEDGFTTEEGGEGIMTPPAHPGCRCWPDTYTTLGEE